MMTGTSVRPPREYELQVVDYPDVWEDDDHPSKDPAVTAEVAQGVVQSLQAIIHDVQKNKATIGPDSAAAASSEAAFSQICLREPGKTPTMWRDEYMLSWDVRCFSGPGAIFSALNTSDLISIEIESGDSKKINNEKSTLPLAIVPPPSFASVDPRGKVPCILFYIGVKTTSCRGHGVARLVQDAHDGGRWKFLSLMTTIAQVNGYGDRVGSGRPLRVGGNSGDAIPPYGELVAAAKKRGLNAEAPDVLIIGGGHNGLMTAARLQQVGIESIIVERETAVGQSWMHRYDRLQLLDTAIMTQLPYLPYPSTWPLHISRDAFASFLRCYADILNLNVWLNTAATKADWDKETLSWVVTLESSDQNKENSSRVLRPKYIVYAAGLFGKPSMPTSSDIPGLSTFSGESLLHSNEFRAAQKDCQGKQIVVIGGGSSAHDIAEEYVTAGASKVTLIQEKPVLFLTQETAIAGVQRLYNDNGLPVEAADLMANSLPRALGTRFQQDVAHFSAMADKDHLDALAAKGFLTNLGAHDAGISLQLIEHSGGFSLNTNAARLIIDGTINVKHGPVSSIKDNNLILQSGDSVPADHLIFATGYHGILDSIKQIFGDKTAQALGPVWGLDKEGELRNAGRPTKVPNLYIVGSGPLMSRSLTRALVLLIKARMEGVAP